MTGVLMHPFFRL